MTDPREENLPRWARDILIALRSMVETQASELAIARGEDAREATGKVIADGLGRDGFALRDRASVTFRLPGGKITVMLRENGTLLDLNSDGLISIMPRAANCAYVSVENRS